MPLDSNSSTSYASDPFVVEYLDSKSRGSVYPAYPSEMFVLGARRVLMFCLRGEGRCEERVGVVSVDGGAGGEGWRRGRWDADGGEDGVLVLLLLRRKWWRRCFLVGVVGADPAAAAAARAGERWRWRFLVKRELEVITLGTLGDDGRAEYAEGSVESAKSV